MELKFNPISKGCPVKTVDGKLGLVRCYFKGKAVYRLDLMNGTRADLYAEEVAPVNSHRFTN